MYTAKYLNIDKSGLQPELIITVEFSNGETVYQSEYKVLPSELDTTFPNQIQTQVDILNAKEIPKEELDARIQTEISVKVDIQPSPIDITPLQ